MSSSNLPDLIDARPLGFPWKTDDPFLFSVHHRDAFPAGNGRLGPAASLAGRNLGQDFENKDGWNMYHGTEVPGFPQHPHRGFETITIVRRGLVDHSDSLGATARFGEGDVQWLTAGRGIVHSEMFPLLDASGPNPAELFQIWLNLPRAQKMVEPHFTMLWGPNIPRVVRRDAAGRAAEITVIAGALDGAVAPAPPPSSWASDPRSDFAIWSVRLDAGAHLELPPAKAGTTRTVYLFEGNETRVAGETFRDKAAVRVRPDVPTRIENGAHPTDLLVLQARPLEEPVFQYGPFVMGTREEVQQAFLDYQRTQFGGWPFPDDAPVHPAGEGRFARHADGRLERAPAERVG